MTCLRTETFDTTLLKLYYSCDDNFHGQQCIPIHKLHREVRAHFDVEPRSRYEEEEDHQYPLPVDDLKHYDISLVGGQVVQGTRGCGIVQSGSSVYFGAVIELVVYIIMTDCEKSKHSYNYPQK